MALAQESMRARGSVLSLFVISIALVRSARLQPD
jgi:hypothetical protein